MIYTVEKKAHTKIILHAAKNAHTSVNGALVGNVIGDEVCIVDAIPLFHTRLMLPAMMEVALAQVDAYCVSKQLKLVGYYHGDVDVPSTGTVPLVDPTAKLIADKVNSQYKHACVVKVDNARFKAPFADSLQLFTRQENGGWTNSSQGKPGQATIIVDSSGAVDALQSNTDRSLVDFENHLEDISLDWLNTQIVV
eukprot:CFRG3366T1